MEPHRSHLSPICQTTVSEDLEEFEITYKMDNANGTFPSYKALSGLPQSQDFPLFFLSPRQGKQSLPHAERVMHREGVLQSGTGAAPLGNKLKPWCKLPGHYLFTTSSSRLACPPPQAGLTQENFREAILSHVNRLHVLSR